MRFVVFAGTPGSGKTSVLISLAKAVQERGLRPSIVKIDCLWTEDDRRLLRLGLPVRIALSKDMCPDHFAIYNIEAMIDWAGEERSDLLLNETAGLCLRCAPYTDSCLAVCVIDVTEREVFRERVLEANPGCQVIDANGLTGKGSAELAEIVVRWDDVPERMKLRNNPPFSICTLCAGETRVEKEHHRGILRRMDGFTEYQGE